jgi:hypothetical protein
MDYSTALRESLAFSLDLPKIILVSAYYSAIAGALSLPLILVFLFLKATPLTMGALAVLLKGTPMVFRYYLLFGTGLFVAHNWLFATICSSSSSFFSKKLPPGFREESEGFYLKWRKEFRNSLPRVGDLLLSSLFLLSLSLFFAVFTDFLSFGNEFLSNYSWAFLSALLSVCLFFLPYAIALGKTFAEGLGESLELVYSRTKSVLFTGFVTGIASLIAFASVAVIGAIALFAAALFDISSTSTSFNAPSAIVFSLLLSCLCLISLMIFSFSKLFCTSFLTHAFGQLDHELKMESAKPVLLPN